MKFKKLVSGLLACAMVVTSVFTGDMSVVQAAAAQTTQLTAPMASYKFNVSDDNARPSLGEGVEALTVGAKNAATVEDSAYVAGRSGNSKDKAVNLGGNFGIRLPQTNIGANYTVSMWVKRTDSMANNFMPILWLGTEGNFIAAAAAWHDKAPTTKTDDSIVWGGGLTAAQEPHFKLAKDQWEMITIAQTGKGVRAYRNGEQILNVSGNAIKEILNGNDRQIYIGVNKYDADGLFPGVIDDIYVYNQELTANEVKALYLKDGGTVSFKTLGALGENTEEGFITTDLRLPASYMGTNLSWESKDKTKITDDGEVKVFDGSEVTLTAKAAFSDGSAWSQDYKVALAKEVTVEYVNKTDLATVLKSKKVKFKKADNYTYVLEDADKVWTSEDAAKTTYVYAGEDADLKTDNATAKVTLKYNIDEVQSVAEIPDIITRPGIKPELPKTVEATFTSGAKRAVEIDWNNLTEDDYKVMGTKQISVGVGAKTVKVNLIVKDKDDFVIADYSFDKGGDGLADGVPGSEKYGTKDGTAKEKIEVKAGLMGNALYLPGGNKGAAYVELPDDVLKVGGSNAKNITVSMFVKSGTDGWSWPMALQSKSGKDNNGGDIGTDYIALINRADNVKGYRAEYRYNNGTQFPAAYSENDNREQWNHFAIVVDSDRHKMSLYRNGKLSGEAENADIDISKLTGGKNYLGHSPFGDQDFKGAIDEFKIYNATLSEKEIKSICDDTLYTAQMKATLDGLKTLETWDGMEADLNKVEDDLKLPVSGKGDLSVITWESTNQEVINTVTPGDGIVTQPYGEDATDAEVTLTATVKIRDYEEIEKVTFNVTVPKREGVDKKPLRHAISDARDEYEAARKKSAIYVASSFEKLKNAFEDAQAALEQADLTEAQVAEKIKTLSEARKLELKNLDQLKGLLTAWYPLDKDAKDASDKGADGVAASSVTYSRDNGATLNGGAALKNMITLPVDKLKVTEQMTFSLRVNAKQKRNLFGIGTVVGNNGGASKMLFLTSAFNAVVTDRGWAGDAAKGYENLAFELNKWHDVTVVLDGMKITLYLDGVKMETKETETTLPDAWNYAEGTKFAYIGNCAYAHNGTGSLDPDFDGSIKDFRIYNAALADEQIASITAYRDALPMAYAKSDLAAAMKNLGATENADGTYALDITQTSVNDQGVLALPAKVNEEKTTVKWEADGTDKDSIDLATNKVTLPAVGTVKNFTLKATIEAAGKTETLTYICRAYTENTSLDKTALNDLIAELKAYKADNYTKTSYDALQAAVQEAYDAVPTLADKAAVDAQIAKLNTAKENLVDLSELRRKIEDLEAELVGMDEEKYTEASWKALKDEIAAAKLLLKKENATKAEVTTQITALTTKKDGLKSCGDKEVLRKAIKEAEELEKYKDSYNNWTSLETALATAKGKLEERLEDYAPAAEALHTAVSNLVVKDGHKLEGTEKAEIQAKFDEAKAEKQNLTKEHFVESSWTAYEEALEALEAVLAKDNAVKEEAQDAAAAVAKARAALVPLSSEKAGSAEKTTLENVIAGVNTASGDYTPESWAVYQSAKAALDNLLERMNAENHNVTKGEITKAITGLETAAANLVPNAGQALTEEDKAAVANTIADAKALNLEYYTLESRTAYRDALKALETLSNRSSTTKNEIKKATDALEEARAALVPIEAQKVTPEKKAEFTTAYTTETGKNLKASDYTAESWARYQAALKAAEELTARLSKEGNNVTKAEVDAVITELKAAAGALIRNTPATNKTALNTAIKAAEKLKEKTYTKATWDKFKASLGAAKAVYAKADATQKQIDDATKDLKAKQNALKVAATKIAVTDKATGSKPAKIAAGKKVTLTAKATAPKGADSSVTWSVDSTSKKKKYASINSKGVLTVSKKAAGKKITVTATSKDGRGAKGTVKITVMKNAVTKITLKAGNKKVKAGKSITVKATVKANGSKANKTLVWSVDKKSAKYASINSKGKLTTKKAGKNKTVTVTAMATDGTNKNATIKIKLTK